MYSSLSERGLVALLLGVAAFGLSACGGDSNPGAGGGAGGQGPNGGTGGSSDGGSPVGGSGGSVDGGSSGEQTGGSAGGGGMAGETGGAAGSGGTAPAGAGGVAGEGGGAGSTAVDPSLGKRDPNAGPGVPKVTFPADQLFKVCAYVNGDATDQDHHNLVSMYDGYMMMPWAHEAGGGGISFYDITQPCMPTRVSVGLSTEMRESHTIAISNIGGKFLVTAYKVPGNSGGGIQVWDISNVMMPRPVSTLELPGHLYPNAYDHVVLAVAPQGRYMYVAAGFDGIFIVDLMNPMMPRLVKTYQVTPPLRAMQVIPIGNMLFASAAEGSRTLLLDISDPIDPQPIPGGDFNIAAVGTTPTNAYSSNVSGGYAYFARQSNTGGLVIYDIKNPSQPTRVGALDDAGGNGGYVFVQGTNAFVGNSGFFSLYDISNPAMIQRVNRFTLTGDQDTITPIGNLALLSVDASAVDGKASAIAPWSMAPDTTPPTATWAYPSDGATALRVTSRIGVTFSEAIDPKSAWRPGAVRVYPKSAGPTAAVAGNVSAIDTVLNFYPDAPLMPQTEYSLDIVAGGIEDYSGNAITKGFTTSFKTGG